MSRAHGKGPHTKGDKQRRKRDLAAEAFTAGLRIMRANPALAAVDVDVCRREDCELSPRDGLVRVDSDAQLHVHPDRTADPETWAWALAHAVLHLGFGHVPAAPGPRTQPDACELAARCVVVDRFLLGSPVGRPPEELPAAYPDGDEERLAAAWRRTGVPEPYRRCGTAGGEPDLHLTDWNGWYGQPPDHQLAFASALTRTVAAAMDVAGGRRDSLDGAPAPRRPWHKALSWFVSSYPLLGGIASGMTLVADAELARAHGISVAAVNAEAGEIYVNPLRVLEDDEWRFVLAHEMLHAALRHGDRCGPRDPILFNVACDFVINGWLVEMDIGTMPGGLLYDKDLAGLSAEEVYDRIAGERRSAAWRPRAARASVTSSAPRSARPATASTSTASTAGASPRAWTCTTARSADCCRPAWSRRSAPSAIRRCPGTPGSPAGSTSSCPAPSRCGPSPGPPGARRPPRTSRARAAGTRPRRSPAAPSASSSTPPAP